MWQLKKEEAWSIGVLMLIAMGGYVEALMPGLSSSDTQYKFSASPLSSPVSKVMVGCLIFAALIPLVIRFREMTRSAFSLLPLVPYLAVAVTSILWSQNPELSVRRVVSLFATSLFGLYFAARFPQRTQLRMLLTATSILAVASILSVWIAPQYATDHNTHAGAWQGVFGGKNECAKIMVIGLSAALLYRPKTVISRLWKGLSLALFVLIIIEARSSGSLLLMVVMTVIIKLLQHLSNYEPRTRTLLSWFMASVFVFISFMGIQFIPEILKLLDRDPTATGRIPLWGQVWQSIKLHPVLGYGYGAFWDGLAGPSARIVLALRWNAPHAHNGFLDVWLCVGLVGLTAFLLAMGQCALRVWQLVRSREMPGNLWIVSSLFLILLYNLDESVLIATPSLMWVILVSSVCGLEMYARQSAEYRYTQRSAVRMRSFEQRRHQPLALNN